jgi:eukaryotic-like serine/threonine-protein kinase
VRHTPLTSARATLSALGVTPTVVSRADMAVPAGSVISERPEPGARVHHGDLVQLVVSSGPPIITVPDVRGMDAASAEHTLLGVRLHPNVASRPADAPPNTVVAQDPLAGAHIRAGSNAVLVVSTGPQPPAASDGDSDGNNATPPPGWLRREWWYLFRHRHRHDPGD